MNFLIPLAFFGLWVAGIIGWIANIVAIFGSSFEPITGELVLRIIGVFVAPLGAIMGLFV